MAPNFFADVIARGQEAGEVHPDRDPVAEAWLFIAGGLLATIDQVLDGGPIPATPGSRVDREVQQELFGGERK